MRAKRHLGLSGAVLGLAALCLVGCAQASSSAPAAEASAYDWSELTGALYTVTRADRAVTQDGAVRLDLTELAGEPLITQGGTYILTGESEATLRIAAEEDEVVRLVLAGISIRSTEGPAIAVESAAKTVLTLAEHTVNDLEDAARYSETYKGYKGCVSSYSDITVNGAGTLRITSLGEDGIHTSDELLILGGELDVTSRRQALFGNDGVAVRGGLLTLQAVGSGIKTGNSKTTAAGRQKGYVDLAGGETAITAGEYGVWAAGDVYVHDCEVQINSVQQAVQAEGAVLAAPGALA